MEQGLYLGFILGQDKSKMEVPKMNKSKIRITINFPSLIVTR